MRTTLRPTRRSNSLCGMTPYAWVADSWSSPERALSFRGVKSLLLRTIVQRGGRDLSQGILSSDTEDVPLYSGYGLRSSIIAGPWWFAYSSNLGLVSFSPLPLGERGRG